MHLSWLMMICVRSFVVYNFMFIDSINLADKRSGATLILFALQFDIFACVYTDTYNIHRYINNNIWHLHSLVDISSYFIFF